MNDNHPDDRVLLYLAFPKPDRKVDEVWAKHVLSCPQCMNDILNMRALAEIISSFDDEDDVSSETFPILKVQEPAYPRPGRDRGHVAYASASPFSADSAPLVVAAAAKGAQPQIKVDYHSYLDSDEEDSLFVQNDSDEKDDDNTLELREEEATEELSEDFFDTLE